MERLIAFYHNIARHVQIWQAAWCAEKERPKQPRRNSHELAFLPAALEVVESPPHPISRAIVWTLISFFLIAVVWATFGEVDVVATAQGRIIPSQRVKQIQPFESGVVRAIHIREGQQVEKGQLLIELDPTQAEADMERLDAEYQSLSAEQVRLATLRLLADGTTTEQQLVVEEAIPDHLAALQQAMLERQWSEHQAQLASIDSQISRRRAEMTSSEEQTKKLNATLPLIAKRSQAMEKMAKKKLVAEHLYLELEQERIENEYDLSFQRSHQKELEAAIEETEQQRRVSEEAFKSEVLANLAETERQLQMLEKELSKARQRNRLQALKAPVSGEVQQLAVHTIGGVVTPAQQLMLIVPKDEQLEVEAWIENRDIGFVQEGEITEIKVETFPFTKYGTIDGEVIAISNDAIADENRGLVYAARVLMKKSVMQVGERLVNLTPGMNVTVEVKTGKRRLIEFFLSPLLRYKQEGLQER